jgi:hypothetical protein
MMRRESHPATADLIGGNAARVIRLRRYCVPTPVKKETGSTAFIKGRRSIESWLSLFCTTPAAAGASGGFFGQMCSL